MNLVTRRAFLSAAGGLALTAAACASHPDDPAPVTEISQDDVDPRPPLLPATQGGKFPGYNFQRVRPEEFVGQILNPHIGTATFQRFNGDPVNHNNNWSDGPGPEKFFRPGTSLHNENYPDTTVSYCRWIWSLIEPEKGKFRWDIIDAALQAAEQHKQSVQMRLQPYIGNDMPSWYWSVGGQRQFGNWQPEHNHLAYLEHFGDLIGAFGQRYDGHPLLESFDIAYGGPCGEGGGNASTETARKLTDIYLQALPRTQLVAMMGTPGCIYAMKLDRPVGWRVDCFGDLRTRGGNESGSSVWDHMHDNYPRVIEQAHAKTQWQRAPITLETCWTVGFWERGNWDIDWLLEQGLKYHPSVFMPKSCYIPDHWMDKIMVFNNRLGYRFVLRQLDMPVLVSPGQRVRVSVWIDNVGVAPIYRSYKLALRYRQDNVSAVVAFNQDIRQWLPDNNWFVEHVQVPAQLQPGPAQVDLAIIDQNQQPRVKLAIQPQPDDGWHAMCPIRVGPAA